MAARQKELTSTKELVDSLQRFRKIFHRNDLISLPSLWDLCRSRCYSITTFLTALTHHTDQQCLE